MTFELDAVILDCDGTLVDSETPGLDVLHEELVKLGVVIDRNEMDFGFRGKSLRQNIETIRQRVKDASVGLSDDFERQVRAAMYARFARGLQPLPGAFELLNRLRIPYCIASNGPRHKMELTLRLCGLWPLVSGQLFSAYDVGSFKPDPGLLLYAARAMGVAPERCAVVEDSLPGIEAGLAAGMTVFALYPAEKTPAEISRLVCFIENLSSFNRLLHDDPDSLQKSSSHKNRELMR